MKKKIIIDYNNQLNMLESKNLFKPHLRQCKIVHSCTKKKNKERLFLLLINKTNVKEKFDQRNECKFFIYFRYNRKCFVDVCRSFFFFFFITKEEKKQQQ